MGKTKERSNTTFAWEKASTSKNSTLDRGTDSTKIGRLSENKGMATRSQQMTVLSWPLWRAGEEGFCPFFVSLSSPVHCLSLSFALDVHSVFFLLLILALNDVWHRSDEISVFLLLNKEFPTCIRLHIHLGTLPSKFNYYATSMSLKATLECIFNL